MPFSSGATLLSIMIPTHGDRGRQSLRLVEQVLSYPGQDFEIVVVDNHSATDPASLFSHIRDDRFRFVRNTHNVGMVRNWNRCVELAHGQWIWIVHSDDLLLPESLSRMREAVKHLPHGGLICSPGLDSVDNGRLVDRNTSYPRLAQRLEAGYEAGRFLLTHPFYCSGMVVSRNAYDRVGTFDSSLPFSADEEFWPRVAAHFPVYFNPNPTSGYCRHGGNSMMATWFDPEFPESYRRTLRGALSHFQSLPGEQLAALSALVRNRLRRNWMVIAFLCLQNGQRQLARRYVAESTTERAGSPADFREQIVSYLSLLPRDVSRILCTGAMRVILSWFPILVRRLLPR